LQIPPEKTDARMFAVVRYAYNDNPCSQPLPALAAGSKAAVILADPPYNQGVEYDGDAWKDRLSSGDYFDLCSRALRHQATWLRPGGTCWWVVPVRHARWLSGLMEAIIGPELYSIAWHERFAVYRHTDLTHDWRMVLVHTNDPLRVERRLDAIRHQSVRQQMGDKRANPAGRIPGTVWQIRRLQGTSTARVKWHPSQLPPELLQRIVLGWSDPSDLVLDAFAGSGSMGVEALRLHRRFVAVERSAVYCRAITARLRAVALEPTVKSWPGWAVPWEKS